MHAAFDQAKDVVGGEVVTERHAENEQLGQNRWDGRGEISAVHLREGIEEAEYKSCQVGVCDGFVCGRGQQPY